MLILFDHGTPAPLIPFLEGHTVTKAKDAGWDKLANGELLNAAERAGFEVLLTTDKKIVAQQNLKSRTIAIVVLGNSQWRIVQRYVRRIAPAVTSRLTSPSAKPRPKAAVFHKVVTGYDDRTIKKWRLSIGPNAPPSKVCRGD
jgi:hypothetical protein